MHGVVIANIHLVYENRT